MLEFTRPLPSYASGTYNMPESGFPCLFTTRDAVLGTLIGKLREVVQNDRRVFFVGGRPVMLSLNWIRDHVHEMKAFRHWEYDVKSFLDLILENQSESGFFYELIKQNDEPHRTFVNEDCVRAFPRDGLALVRLEIEADVEYIVVEGALYVYRCTADEGWIRRALPKLEKAIDYVTSDPKRWDAERGLVKRGYTIDTWDFADNVPGSDRRIHPDRMAIMHGDNSGVYGAMKSLAWLRRRFGDADAAEAWELRAARLRDNMMCHLWNGRFFLHQLPLGHDGVDGAAAERERLSMSNTYDMNRGVLGGDECRGVIDEFRARRETTDTFAEWFSIDPPYEQFGAHARGTYVNGGITSFTAGELAKAAFENGREAYGWDILQRVDAMVRRDGTLYFLYDPHDAHNLGGGPSGWGAASLLNAVDEGLAGIRDADVLYRAIDFSPRFAVTGYEELRYITGYEATGVVVDLRWRQTDRAIGFSLRCPASRVRCHVLLPEGRRAARVLAPDGIAFAPAAVGDSRYADFTLTSADPSDTQRDYIVEIELV